MRIGVSKARLKGLSTDSAIPSKQKACHATGFRERAYPKR